MKASPLPDIGLRYIESLEDPVFEEFCRELAADGLNLRVESAPDPGPFMALEWLIPTAVFVYLGKSYFDGFLKEAGKDHYLILKKSLSKLSSKFFGKDAPQGRIISTPGKSLSEIPKYSIIYSVVAEVDKDLRVKLLLQADMNLIQCNEAQESFLDFLASIHDGSLNVATVKGLADAKPIGDTLLLEYDLTAKALVVVDPLAEHRRPGA